MNFRGIDNFNNNFGFRLQYNRLFKPEYLPARVRYNQFFFGIALLAGLAITKKYVSGQLDILINFSNVAFFIL